MTATTQHQSELDDVVDAFETKAQLHVRYAGGVDVDAGCTITAAKSKTAPNVVIEGLADSSAAQQYTLVMSDPDAPSRRTPRAREWLHWIVVNIPGEVAKGVVVCPYAGPTPPKGTGPHRYIFVLYRQAAAMPTAAFEERPQFHSKQFARDNHLVPVAATYFLCENK